MKHTKNLEHALILVDYTYTVCDNIPKKLHLSLVSHSSPNLLKVIALLSPLNTPPYKFKCNAPKLHHLHVPFLFNYIYHLALWPSLTNGTHDGGSGE